MKVSGTGIQDSKSRLIDASKSKTASINVCGAKWVTIVRGLLGAQTNQHSERQQRTDDLVGRDGSRTIQEFCITILVD
ncbi:hypothetical protein E4U21_001044 [Claviceps maximensis]|nr:hypothetical protein E4U21_001044 [Claviceps maximensis]